MRRWTQKERQRQSMLIRACKPWERSTGPTTPEGKARSRMNAIKHGLYNRECKFHRKASREYRRTLQQMSRLMKLMGKPRFSKRDVKVIAKLIETESEAPKFDDVQWLKN